MGGMVVACQTILCPRPLRTPSSRWSGRPCSHKERGGWGYQRANYYYVALHTRLSARWPPGGHRASVNTPSFIHPSTRIYLIAWLVHH